MLQVRRMINTINILSFEINLVEESIQTGESCTEKALPSCSCRNLTSVKIKLLTSVKIKLLTTLKINVVIAILITGLITLMPSCHMIDD